MTGWAVAHGIHFIHTSDGTNWGVERGPFCCEAGAAIQFVDAMEVGSGGMIWRTRSGGEEVPDSGSDGGVGSDGGTAWDGGTGSDGGSSLDAGPGGPDGGPGDAGGGSMNDGGSTVPDGGAVDNSVSRCGCNSVPVAPAIVACLLMLAALGKRRH